VRALTEAALSPLSGVLFHDRDVSVSLIIAFSSEVDTGSREENASK
jgi:hypothetical protein